MKRFRRMLEVHRKISYIQNMILPIAENKDAVLAELSQLWKEFKDLADEQERYIRGTIPPGKSDSGDSI